MAMAMAMACTSASHLTAVAPQLLTSTFTSTFRPRMKVAAPLSTRRNHGALVIRANDMLGDFGARDPYPEEIASDFGNIVLGNNDTEHQILVPTLQVLSLSERAIKPIPEGTAPYTEAEAKALLRKVVGWRLINQGSSEPLKLQCDWNLKDSDSITELYARIGNVGEAEGYPYDIQTLESNKVRVEVWTQSIGGLCENDFIFASKIDQVDTKDLTKKIRTWF